MGDGPLAPEEGDDHRAQQGQEGDDRQRICAVYQDIDSSIGVCSTESRKFTPLGSCMASRCTTATAPRPAGPRWHSWDVAGLNAPQDVAHAGRAFAGAIHHDIVDGARVHDPPQELFRNHAQRAHDQPVIKFVHVVFVRQNAVKVGEALRQLLGNVRGLQIPPEATPMPDERRRGWRIPSMPRG